MRYLLKYDKNRVEGEIQLPASKSESNRVLIIQYLCKQHFEIKNISEANDTRVLQTALANSRIKATNLIDVGDAGTAFRFLTALLAITEGEWILRGSERMHERPIGALVDALKQLGAEIEFVEKRNFPPLRIKGRKLDGGKITIDGTVSSQFISALMLIAPTMPNGLTITIQGKLVSESYVAMTRQLLKQFGVKVEQTNNQIKIEPSEYSAENFKNLGYEIESDWSAASYWYSVAALSEDCKILLKGVKKDSLQGDSVVTKLYESFGVKTIFTNVGVELTKLESENSINEFDFISCPDLAQTAAVTAILKTKAFVLAGLHTLSDKETDRIRALLNELNNIGTAEFDNAVCKLIVKMSVYDPQMLYDLKMYLEVSTYNDHRMAMAFAPLIFSGFYSGIIIKNPAVVNKSYPAFWEDLKRVGVEIG